MLRTTLIAALATAIACAGYRFQPPDKYPAGCGPDDREWRLLVREGLGWWHVGEEPLPWAEWNDGASFDGRSGDIEVTVKHYTRSALTLLVDRAGHGERDIPLREQSLCRYANSEFVFEAT